MVVLWVSTNVKILHKKSAYLKIGTLTLYWNYLKLRLLPSVSVSAAYV